MKNTPATTREEMIQSAGQVLAGLSLVAWSLEALTTGANPPESEGRRFELYTGMVFVLETTRQILSDVYHDLNMDCPAR